MSAPRMDLVRFAMTPYGTFGRLRCGDREWFTVEKPWNNNVPQTSCIPAANYFLRLGTYNHGGYPAYEIIGVPDRSMIKIHKANLADELLGCIAPGKELGWIKNKWAVTRSSEAYTELMATAEVEQPLTINIKWAIP
jgi:hypothetical protein